MTTQARTTTHDVPIPLQILGALLLVVISVVAVTVAFHVATAVLAKLIPLVIVGATLWVLVRLMVDSGKA